jgi:hypothetical protein
MFASLTTRLKQCYIAVYPVKWRLLVCLVASKQSISWQLRQEWGHSGCTFCFKTVAYSQRTVERTPLLQNVPITFVISRDL